MHTSNYTAIRVKKNTTHQWLTFFFFTIQIQCQKTSDRGATESIHLHSNDKCNILFVQVQLRLSH